MAGTAWFFYALSAAALWGLGYALSEKLLKQAGIPPSFLLVIQGIVTFLPYLVVSYYLGTLKIGMDAVMMQKWVLPVALLMCLCIVLGNYFILTSISLKNATLSNVIEITYPLFTLLFAFLIFRDVQINLWSALGAGLILSGVVVILTKS